MNGTPARAPEAARKKATSVTSATACPVIPPHGMSMTRATAARNTPLAARASPTATRMRAQKRVKLGFIAPPGVDSVVTEYSGRLHGVSTKHARTALVPDAPGLHSPPPPYNGGARTRCRRHRPTARASAAAHCRRPEPGRARALRRPRGPRHHPRRLARARRLGGRHHRLRDDADRHARPGGL